MTESEVETWITTFYQHRDTSKLVEALTVLGKRGQFSKPNTAGARTMVGLILQLATNEQQIEAGKVLIRYGAKIWFKATLPYLTGVKTPAEMDVAWAHFYVTGDKKYVDMLVTIGDGKGDLAQIARWSLMGNQHHPIVKAAIADRV